MEGALRHRGPDGDGHYRSGDVGMVQTRLAIIDLATGDQPLYEPGGAALVANGEIYNYIELKRDLPGAVFATGSDCELPLHLYRRYGLDFPRHLRGMYAIALARSRRRPAGAGARSLRHQAALLRRDAARPGLCLRAPGAASAAAWSKPTLNIAGAQRAAAIAVHHRPRNRLRRHPSRPAGRDRGRDQGPHRRAPAARGAARAGAAARQARRKRSPPSTAPSPTASTCISAPTCLTACSSRAASIPRPCWR